MPKSSDLMKGRRARKRGVPFCTLNGVDASADLLPMSGREYGRVLEYATAYAESRHAKPEEGNAVYEYGKDIMTVAIALVDSASPDDAPEPFYANADDLLDELHPDWIRVLAERQRFHQDVVSPLQQAMTSEEFYARIVQLAGDEELDRDPFERCAPSLRLNFERTLARIYLQAASTQPPPKSSSGSNNAPEQSESGPH